MPTGENRKYTGLTRLTALLLIIGLLSFCFLIKNTPAGTGSPVQSAKASAEGASSGFSSNGGIFIETLETRLLGVVSGRFFNRAGRRSGFRFLQKSASREVRSSGPIVKTALNTNNSPRRTFHRHIYTSEINNDEAPIS